MFARILITGVPCQNNSQRLNQLHIRSLVCSFVCSFCFVVRLFFRSVLLLVCSFVLSFCFVLLFVCALIRFVCLFIRSFVHLFVNLLVHLFVCSFVRFVLIVRSSLLSYFVHFSSVRSSVLSFVLFVCSFVLSSVYFQGCCSILRFPIRCWIMFLVIEGNSFCSLIKSIWDGNCGKMVSSYNLHSMTIWFKRILAQFHAQGSIRNNGHQWMWSGAHGSTHDSSARGPGFDPSPKIQDGNLEAPISLLSDNRLKSDVPKIVMSSWNK